MLVTFRHAEMCKFAANVRKPWTKPVQFVKKKVSIELSRIVLIEIKQACNARRDNRDSSWGNDTSLSYRAGDLKTASSARWILGKFETLRSNSGLIENSPSYLKNWPFYSDKKSQHLIASGRKVKRTRFNRLFPGAISENSWERTSSGGR